MARFIAEFPSIDSPDWKLSENIEKHLLDVEKSGSHIFDRLCEFFKLGSAEFFRLAAQHNRPEEVVEVYRDNIEEYFNVHAQACDRLESVINL